jgi:hypothetical protein
MNEKLHDMTQNEKLLGINVSSKNTLKNDTTNI